MMFQVAVPSQTHYLSETTVMYCWYGIMPVLALEQHFSSCEWNWQRKHAVSFAIVFFSCSTILFSAFFHCNIVKELGLRYYFKIRLILWPWSLSSQLLNVVWVRVKRLKSSLTIPGLLCIHLHQTIPKALWWKCTCSLVLLMILVRSHWALSQYS